MATDRQTLENWIRDLGQMVESKSDPADAWECLIDGVSVILICSEPHDRMRAMALIGSAQNVDGDTLRTLLEANFDRAIDAKYAISHGQIWSLFVHPLAGLERALFTGGVQQVVALHRAYGTTYASGEHRFENR